MEAITSLDARIADARARADFETALGLAGERARLLAAHRISGWRRADARRECTDLQRLCALPDTARARWRQLAARAPSEWEAECRPDSVLTELSRWKAACEQWMGRDAPEAASALAAMAMVHEKQGQWKRAYELDSEALAIRMRILGPRHPGIAASLDRTALDLKRAGWASDQVLSLCNQALEMRRHCLGAQSSEYASSLLRHANFMRNRKQLALALREFAQAEAIFQQNEGDTSPNLAEALVDHGLTLASLRQWTAVEPLLRRGLEISRSRPGPPSEVLALALNQQGVALRELERVDEAEAVLREAVAVQEARRSAAPPGPARALRFPVAAHRDLALLKLQHGQWADAWVELERASSRSSIDRAMACGDLTPVADPWADLLPRVQRALPDSAAMIGWVDSQWGAEADWPCWYFVIRKTGAPYWTRVEAPPDVTEPVQVRIRTLALTLIATAQWPLRIAYDPQVETLSREIYRLRIAPLEPALHGIRRLIVATPSTTYGAPVEAFIDGAGRPLSERFVTLYSPSALLYACARERRAKPVAPSQWRGLFFGGPAGQGAGTVWDSLPPLRHAVEEMQDMARHLEQADIFVGPRASECTLDSLSASGALANYEFIHIATHVDVREQFTHYAAMLLADAHPEPRGQHPAGHVPKLDGWLTVEEVERWRLNARLVNLAACRGFSVYSSSSGDPVGIGSAILGAGARSLLVTANAVDDEASELFFSRLGQLLFARGQRRRDIATAVRDARLWLRDYRAADGTQPYRNPAFWSGFMLVGWPD